MLPQSPDIIERILLRASFPTSEDHDHPSRNPTLNPPGRMVNSWRGKVAFAHQSLPLERLSVNAEAPRVICHLRADIPSEEDNVGEGECQRMSVPLRRPLSHCLDDAPVRSVVLIFEEVEIILSKSAV